MKLLNYKKAILATPAQIKEAIDDLEYLLNIKEDCAKHRKYIRELLEKGSNANSTFDGVKQLATSQGVKLDISIDKSKLAKPKVERKLEFVTESICDSIFNYDHEKGINELLHCQLEKDHLGYHRCTIAVKLPDNKTEETRLVTWGIGYGKVETINYTQEDTKTLRKQPNYRVKPRI